MARTSKAMKNDWDFDVRMDSLNHQGVMYDNERYAVKVGENGQRDRVIASGHTKQYNAVSNRAVIGAIRNAFDSNNMKWDGQHYDAHRSRLTGKAVYQDTEDIKVTHNYKKNVRSLQLHGRNRKAAERQGHSRSSPHRAQLV